jgi:hypothetical protein
MARDSGGHLLPADLLFYGDWRDSLSFAIKGHCHRVFWLNCNRFWLLQPEHESVMYIHLHEGI